MAAPAAAAALTITPVEGTQFSGRVATSCTVAGPVTIDWGDGMMSAGTLDTAGGIDGTHTYAEEGTFDGSLSGCAAVSQPTFTADVADALLHASPAGATQATAGQQFSGTVATFVDADPGGIASDYTTTIAWGDGSQSAGTVAGTSAGFEVTGNHTYTNAGNDTATVMIADAGGAQATAQTAVNVVSTGPPPVQAAFTPPPGPVQQAGQLLLDASPSRPSGATVQSYGWSLNGKQVASCDGSTSMMSTHFNAPGTYSVGLQVTDGAGAVTSTSHQIVVQPQPGTRDTRAAKHVNEINTEQVFTCTRAASDPLSRVIAPNALTTLGLACNTQVNDGIIRAVGCLTEHYEQNVTVFATPSNGGILYMLNTDPGQIPDIPTAEAKTLLQTIEKYYGNGSVCGGKNQPPCQTVGGYLGYEPPPQGGNLGLDAIQHRQVHLSPDRRAATAAAGAQSQTQVITPCSARAPLSGVNAQICLDLYLSSGPVFFNGVEYRPQTCSGHTGVILFAPQFDLVVSSCAELDVADLQAQAPGPIDYQFPDMAQDPNSAQTAIDFPNLQALLAAEPDQGARQQAMGEFGHVPGDPGFVLDPSSDLRITFQDGVTTIAFHVDLPGPFSNATIAVFALIDSDGNFTVVYGYLGNANGGGVSVNLGPVKVSDFAICFRHEATNNTTDPTKISYDPCPNLTGIPDQPSFGKDFWDATGTISVGGYNVIFRPGKIAPGCQTNPPLPADALGLGFSGTGLKFAGAELQTPGIAIGTTGITFEQLLISYISGSDWDTIRGCTVFAAGKLIELTGGVFLVFVHSPQTPYQFNGGEVADVTPEGPLPYTQDFGIEVGGAVLLTLPVINQQVNIANGYVIYVDDPAALAFGAFIDVGIPNGTYENPPDIGIGFKGGFSGIIGFNSGAWEFEAIQDFIGKLNLGFLGEHTVAQGTLQEIVSDDPRNSGGGIGACGYASLFDNAFQASAGIAYPWGASLFDVLAHHLVFSKDSDVCADNWLENQIGVSVQARDRARAAAASATVRIPAGVTALNLDVHGAGGAPDITIHGPGGASASTAGQPLQKPVRSASFVLVRIPWLRETFVQPLHPRPGNYVISANAGSVAITSLTRMEGMAPDIAARVTGSGFHRRLVYRIPPRHGEVVTFYERSRQVSRQLGTAHGTSGSIAFLAAAGRGRRAIVAEVRIGGAPSTMTPVTSYLAPALQRLAKVRRLHVSRRGLTILATFAPVAGATGYRIAVASTDGARATFVTHTSNLRFSRLLYFVGGRVTVVALGDRVTTLDGARVSVGFAAAITPPKLRRF
jgi:PKD repeat protein